MRRPSVVMDLRDLTVFVTDDDSGAPVLQLTDGVEMVSLEPGLPGASVPALLGAERLLTAVQQLVADLRREAVERAVAQGVPT